VNEEVGREGETGCSFFGAQGQLGINQLTSQVAVGWGSLLFGSTSKAASLMLTWERHKE
jgi:hypothetical protein